MAEWILKVTQGSQAATSMIILWASGVISGIIDNIPYTATMSPMLVSQYQLQLPDKAVLEKKLQQLVNIPQIED